MNKYLFLLLFLTSCGSGDRKIPSQPAAVRNDSNVGAYVVDSAMGRLNGVYVGMSEFELSSLRYPESRGVVRLEGDDYVAIDVSIDGKVPIECILAGDGSVERFSTASSLVHDERGIGVGATVRELKMAYPAGRLLVGDEDGRFARFVNGSKVVFSLDKSKIDDVCFDNPVEKCKVDEQGVKVERVVVNRHVY
ncbi:hypothetical protein K4L06_13265 [Lysobacter sp. BMK333-48F3]|uniref:hypothetical protein n=1 Tax=Lysobacter sp. BMK333-48F3 TaxID=2867962 RepID=UPI001C8C820D|nr:hypothetical protein [Lysobacter sp. BMK333-48F3]MBX9402278.1 hypothetical protein [Lysobacter sp. BMK333-48F3]